MFPFIATDCHKKITGIIDFQSEYKTLAKFYSQLGQLQPEKGLLLLRPVRP